MAMTMTMAMWSLIIMLWWHPSSSMKLQLELLLVVMCVGWDLKTFPSSFSFATNNYLSNTWCEQWRMNMKKETWRKKKEEVCMPSRLLLHHAPHHWSLIMERAHVKNKKYYYEGSWACPPSNLSLVPTHTSSAPTSLIALVWRSKKMDVVVMSVNGYYDTYHCIHHHWPGLMTRTWRCGTVTYS